MKLGLTIFLSVLSFVALVGCQGNIVAEPRPAAAASPSPTTRADAAVELAGKTRWIMSDREKCVVRMLALLDELSKQSENPPLSRRDRFQCRYELIEVKSLFETVAGFDRLLDCYRIDLAYAAQERDDPKFTGGWCGTGQTARQARLEYQADLSVMLSSRIAELESPTGNDTTAKEVEKCKSSEVINSLQDWAKMDDESEKRDEAWQAKQAATSSSAATRGD